MINHDVEARSRELGQTPEMTSGEKPLSAVWVPLVVGDEVRGIISLQNIDREDAFSDSDVELLTTLAASLSVALENVRLIDETRQRLAELATVNEVGQALSSQLDLDDAPRARRRADAPDVRGRHLLRRTPRRAERDEIEFPVLPRVREADRREPFAFGEGLTSRILSAREPPPAQPRVGLGRASGRAASGLDAKSYLGVPILAGDRAIGAISVQSTTREGRFGEADARLLSTIAANVGVAIQNARLYQEAHRRGDEMAALAEVGQEISATLDVQAVLERIGERVQTLLSADTIALFLAGCRARRRTGRSSPSASSPTRSGPTRSSRARGSSATSSGGATPEFVNDTERGSRGR